MNVFTDQKELGEHILIRNLIDLKYLEPYIEVALRRKIYPYIPKAAVTEIMQIDGLSSLLKKTVAHYTVPIAIPFIKVSLTNTGIQNFKDGDLINAQWWDVRDMALQCVKVADEALTDLIDELLKTQFKGQLTVLEKFNTVILSPDEFFELTELNGGYDVFMSLLPSIRHVWEFIIRDKFPDCVFDDLENDIELNELFKRATAYYAAAEAVNLMGFAFTRNGVFLQWEQLPWQKSALLTPEELSNYRKNMSNRANSIIGLIWNYLNQKNDEYPCLNTFKLSDRAIHIRKSGIYF